jgi:1-hydroxycarotenoid 3,4-desaturase
VVVVGAGIGGLVSAALLGARGFAVTVVEKEERPGGKVRRVCVDGQPVDAGPTVFTLRGVFEEIFAEAGAALTDHVTLRAPEVLARHAWDEGARLDLYADPLASEAAIGDFAGAGAARGYRAFRAEAQRIHGILDKSMMRAGKVSWPLPLMWRIGLLRVGDLAAIRPYESLWKVLGEHFTDPRLRQLFGRYSTYCGSSPFETPATLMLVAHVEAMGVWLIDGGMSALAEALVNLGRANGVTYRFGAPVGTVLIERGRAAGVVLAGDERIAADAVIVNADPAALAAGCFGPDAVRAAAPMPVRRRSLSAFTWLAHAQTSGFALQHHNVFFSGDYPAEFRDIRAGQPPESPSVYVCAQDRDGPQLVSGPVQGRERLQIIVNAPANGDSHIYTPKEIDQCGEAMTARLKRCGLMLEAPLVHELAHPQTFAKLFPATGGALYGRASHGWAASFLRQGTRTKIPGLFCAGGSTHPGAGVPMAALSGRLAAETITRMLASMRRFHPAATVGGTSMRSATTGATG